VSTESVAEEIVKVLREKGDLDDLAELVGSGSTEATGSQDIGSPGESSVSADVVLAENAEQLEIAHVNSVLNSHALWKAIGAMNDELDEAGGKGAYSVEQLVVRVASTTGAGLLAAVSAYLLRGGALLASLISASPLWSVYDPLPVLRDTNDEKRLRVRKKTGDKTGADEPKSPEIETLFGDQG
jgi:hypothetical protein